MVFFPLLRSLLVRVFISAFCLHWREEHGERRETWRNIYKINECICYAPLNRLLSVYRPALRETISKLILFSPHSFASIPFLLFRVSLVPQRTRKKNVILAGILESIELREYDARRSNSSRASDICFHLPIWCCCSTINSILRLMVVIQTAQVIAMNRIFRFVSVPRVFFLSSESHQNGMETSDSVVSDA